MAQISQKGTMGKPFFFQGEKREYLSHEQNRSVLKWAFQHQDTKKEASSVHLFSEGFAT